MGATDAPNTAEVSPADVRRTAATGKMATTAKMSGAAATKMSAAAATEVAAATTTTTASGKGELISGDQQHAACNGRQEYSADFASHKTHSYG